MRSCPPHYTVQAKQKNTNLLFCRKKDSTSGYPQHIIVGDNGVVAHQYDDTGEMCKTKKTGRYITCDIQNIDDKDQYTSVDVRIIPRTISKRKKNNKKKKKRYSKRK